MPAPWCTHRLAVPQGAELDLQPSGLGELIFFASDANSRLWAPCQACYEGWASKLSAPTTMRPWEFGVGIGVVKESPSGGLMHLPAIPSSVNSFQNWQHYVLAGGLCSHNLGVAQDTPTGCTQEASGVACILLQNRFWKFPWEHLQHHQRMICAWM